MSHQALAAARRRRRPRRHALAGAAALLVQLVAGACSSGATGPGKGGPAPTPCTFTNPIDAGADPWVVRANGAYFLVESRDNGIYVYRSTSLTALKANAVKVWTAPASGWNHSNVWAPELHFIDGHWYIYYAAGRLEGGPYIEQRSGVLESVGDDPQGSYTDKGMLYTGNDVASGTEPIWAIDLTVERVNGQLYAVWSGWSDNTPASGQLPDRKPQQLYIAKMANPWTISTNRVLLSSPVASWERGTELDLQEGPEFLQHGTDTFIIYSTRESWLPDYRLGQLRLNSAGADLTNPANWTKSSGPVFAAASGVYGVGHASFTTSPDGTESWIVYHSKVDQNPGWNRVIRAQQFGWNADGSPNFGTPVASGTAVKMPSGQCTG